MQSAAASNNRVECRMQSSNLGKTNYSREKTQTQICFTWLSFVTKQKPQSPIRASPSVVQIPLQRVQLQSVL